jgi:hypothetical protein
LLVALWWSVRGRAVFSLRCFVGEEGVVKPACWLVRFRGDEAGVVAMVAGLLIWWMLGGC